MNLELIKSTIPDFAKDIKLNFSGLFTTTMPCLSTEQTVAIAYAAVLSSRNDNLSQLFEQSFAQELAKNTIMAVKSAVSIMAMNNIYYRFLHLSSNADYQKMPARLRMNVYCESGRREKLILSYIL